MKFGPQLPLSACFYTLMLLVAWADPALTTDTSSSLTNIEIAPLPSSDSSGLKSTPSLSEAAARDIPPTITPWVPRRQLSSDEITALQEKADKESNWLIYGYQEAMRHNSTSHETDDLYFKGTSDKDSANSSTYRTGATSDGKSAVTLRDDASSKTDGKNYKTSLLSDKVFKPFFTPLGSSEVTSLRNSDGSSFFSASHVELSKKPSLQSDTDTDIDDALTPGLTAARNDPRANPAYLDPSLDLLPGESSTHAKAHQDFFTSSQAPTGSSLVELQSQQKLILAPPEPLRAARPVVISPLLLTPDDKLSISKPPGVPAQPPVRPRVADPRDFLNR